jgi:L-malate glycosyltransferase
MHIGIAGPLSFQDIAHLLPRADPNTASEMKGSSLLVCLIEELLSRGYKISAYTTEPGLDLDGPEYLLTQSENFIFYQVPLRKKGFRSDRGRRGRMLDLFAFERQCIQAAIEHSKVDIVHAHWSYEFAWAAQNTKKPLLITCHDAPWKILKLMPDLYRLGRLLMAHFVLARAKHLTAVSPYVIDNIKWMHRAKTAIIPNPLPADLFISNKGENNTIIIGMIINNWSKLKNGAAGMMALRDLKRQLPAVKLHLYGPGMGVHEAAWQWAKLHHCVDDFVFFGSQPYAVIKAAIINFKILLHPSLEESFGMTIAEAMAVGVPVIAGEKSGAVPWVLSHAGLLVDVRKPQLMLNALLTLINNQALYEECAESGRRRAKECFAVKSVVEQYITQYQLILRRQDSEK